MGRGASDPLSSPLIPAAGTSYTTQVDITRFKDSDGRLIFNRATGYFYYNVSLSQYASHELAHIFGLADRYHEMKRYARFGDEKEYADRVQAYYPIMNSKYAHFYYQLYGRETVPMILCEGVDPPYDFMTNLMSAPIPPSAFQGELTPAQMAIVFSNRDREKSYPTVIFISGLIASDYRNDHSARDLKPWAAKVYRRGGIPSIESVINRNLGEMKDKSMWVIPKKYRKTPLPAPYEAPKEPRIIIDKEDYFYSTYGVVESIMFNDKADFLLKMDGKRSETESICIYNARIIESTGKVWED